MRRLMLSVLCIAALSPALAGATTTTAARSDAAVEESTDLTPYPFDSLTTARYRLTAGALAKALATDDARAFRALHSDSGWAQADDWWQGMLAMQKRRYGPVVRVVGPLRGTIRAGGTGVGVPRDGAAILLRFEKRLGASMSFTLDSLGRVATSSLWIQDWLADANTDGAEVLWEAKPKGANR